MSNKGDGHGAFASVDLLAAAHRARLTPSDVGRGVLAAHRNARRLLLDALCLFEHGRYAGALSAAILAHEEGGKWLPLALAGIFERELPPLVALAFPGVSPLRDTWRDFMDHVAKSATTLRLHALVMNVPAEAREVLEREDPRSIAHDYGTMRQRATYVDCVQGPERWSVPEAVVDREAALTMLGAARKALGHIVLPAHVAQLLGNGELGTPEQRQAMLDWSKSQEASELSELDLRETGEWRTEVDSVLERMRQR